MYIKIITTEKLSIQNLRYMKKNRASFRFHSIILVLLTSMFACERMPDEHWVKTIPEYTPVVIIPERGVSISDQLRADYMPLLDDVTASALSLISQVENEPQVSVLLRSIALVPTRAVAWHAMWILETRSGLLERIASQFEQPFTINSYRFSNQVIRVLHIEERPLYAVELGRWLLVSESSFAIEEAIRTYLGENPSLDINPDDIRNNRLLVNSGHLDRWLSQVAAVRERPRLVNSLQGLGPIQFAITSNDKEDDILDYSFEGYSALLSEGQRSSFTQAISSENRSSDLDRYVPLDAAAFAEFRRHPQLNLPANFEPQTALDTLLVNDSDLFDAIASTLEPDFAYVALAASGFLSVGEKMYLRKLSNTREFFRILADLARRGYLERDDTIFFAESALLAQLLGSDLCDFTEFYLTTTFESAVLSPRSGLTQRVRSDRSRRRVLYYDDTYASIRASFPDETSAFFFVRSNDYLQYLSTFLSPQHYGGALVNQFDIAAMGVVRENQRLNIAMKTYTTEVSDSPFQERWIFPLDGSDLTGNPVIANIGGSQRNEILFATDNGNVFALAADGTTVLQVRTGSDKPLGSPVVYDWYGNNQNVIMIAAGNKIYAWNTRGIPLPNFPFELDEEITAPITVTDVTRNGLSEVIVATADRQVHVLDGRGRNVSGWPQTTNAVVNNRPVFQQIGGNWSVWVFSENGIFSWAPNGNRREGYPIFGNTQFTGYPVFYQENLLAAGADGFLYSFGRSKQFADTLATEQPDIQNYDQLRSDGFVIQSINISNSPLIGPPILQNMTVRSDGSDYRENMIITLSQNGAVFVYNQAGLLRRTESMGQPAARNQPPIIRGLKNRNRPELIILAEFGRIYSWEAYNGERNFDLPTAAMRYPIFYDIFGDGRVELIARTRNGLQAWSLGSR